MSEQVPAEVRRLAEEVYTPEGVRIWWAVRNKMLDRKTPAEMWMTDPDRVLAYLESLADGNFA